MAIYVIRAPWRRPLAVADVPDRVSSDAADRRDLDLVAALATLPDKQRQAVAYHYLAGLSYAQIAGLLGSTEAAARRAAADGIARLRRVYPADDAGDLVGDSTSSSGSSA
jgi:RNA polymerase sigma factor (sigma-70 family)